MHEDYLGLFLSYKPAVYDVSVDQDNFDLGRVFGQILSTLILRNLRGSRVLTFDWSDGQGVSGHCLCDEVSAARVDRLGTATACSRKQENEHRQKSKFESRSRCMKKEHIRQIAPAQDGYIRSRAPAVRN